MNCSLQNRRDFFRISGEQGEDEASARRARSAKRELRARGGSLKNPASRSPRFRPCSPEIRKKITPVLQAI